MRHALRLLAVAFLAVTSTTGVAAAKRRPPPDGGASMPRPAPPPPVDHVQGTPQLVGHVEDRALALGACMTRNRNTVVAARATLRWDARGRVLSTRVSGGSAAFNRCAARALRGRVIGVAARGTGRVSMTVRNTGASPSPAPQPPVILPAPRPPIVKPAPGTRPVDIHACTTDADCTLHFRTHACISGDPVAVNTLDPAAVRATYPVTHVACGMGGPQYDSLRASNEGRYSAACERSRCVVRDAGPRKDALPFPQ